MKKTVEFKNNDRAQMNDKIEKTLNADFKLPKSVCSAKKQAFQQIRSMEAEAKQKEEVLKEASVEFPPQPVRKRPARKFRTGAKIATGVAAAAALFSGVCITNPALAANIPLVGSIFEEIGTSLGFSGDYSEFAKPLEETADPVEVITETEGTEGTADSAAAGETEDTAAAEDTAYSKTFNGVTLTMSETYCNNAALYLSMLIESEEPIPETEVSMDGTPLISLGQGTPMALSYNPDCILYNAVLDGKMLDEHTYAGVLRIDLRETTANYKEYERYYEDRNAYFREQGVDLEKLDELGLTLDQAAQQLGMKDFSEGEIAAAGGPDAADYALEYVVPEEFTAELNISKIVGTLPQDQVTTPEMPAELLEEYNQAMAEHGLDSDNYANFTEEEKEIERQLHSDMWNKYTQMYPDTTGADNLYENWVMEGDWTFTLNLKKDLSKNETREINLLDENGTGVVSITRTPFEIQLEEVSNADYFSVVVDADGDLLPYGKFGGSASTWAIQDRDVSKVDVYVCDYIEYMDEIKGYYWSEDYEEKKKTKTFKEYLDERALMHAEVVFDE